MKARNILFLISLIVLSACAQTAQQKIEKQCWDGTMVESLVDCPLRPEQKPELSNEIKQEICRDIKEYINYCYETGIDIQPCVNQIMEKLPRVYGLSNKQVQAVTSSC